MRSTTAVRRAILAPCRPPPDEHVCDDPRILTKSEMLRRREPQRGRRTVFKPVVETSSTRSTGTDRPDDMMTTSTWTARGCPRRLGSPSRRGARNQAPVSILMAHGVGHEDYYDTTPTQRSEARNYRDYDGRAHRNGSADGSDPTFASFINTRQNEEGVNFATLATKDQLHPSQVGTRDEASLQVAGSSSRKPFEIWAPEEDTSGYYGKFQPLSVASSHPTPGVVGTGAPPNPLPPSGVDAGAFYNLVEARLRGIGDNILAIDKAANNTSVVFLLQWRGWRLLFAGDAEVRSWKTMNREGVLKPVHFLKVSHHGSHNGTPEDDIFEASCPSRRPTTDAHRRHLHLDRTYPGIPTTPPTRV